MPGLGGCRNEKNPESALASSMNRSSGTRIEPCAPMASRATPNAWSMMDPAEDMSVRGPRRADQTSTGRERSGGKYSDGSDDGPRRGAKGALLEGGDDDG